MSRASRSDTRSGSASFGAGTGTDPIGVRVSVLGGEVSRRGLLAGAPRTRGSRLSCAGAALGCLVVLLSSPTVPTAVCCAAALAAIWWLAWPPAGTDRTRLDGWVIRRGYRTRSRRHLASFTAASELTHDTLDGWQYPPAVGTVEPLDLSDSEWGQLFVLYHHPAPGEQFLTVLTATDGLGAGLWTDAEYAARQAGFGALLAGLPKPTRWITALGQIARTLPQDLTEHTAIILDQLDPPYDAAPQQVRTGYDTLVGSYDQVITDTGQRAEEHRNYLSVRIDITAAFEQAAARIAPGPAGWAKIVRDELLQLGTASESAGLGRLQILGEQRTVAATRALQNADYQPDRHAGLSWADAFCSYTSAVDHLLVEDTWHTRLAAVPFRGLDAALLSARWLAPVLITLEPSVIRTVATVLRPVPASQARPAAKADATTDEAAARTDAAAGRRDDGTTSVLRSASERRLSDLAPGTGHSGLDWAMFFAMQARTLPALEDACAILTSAAADAGIESLDWLTHEQDLAWPTMLGLTRGMAS